MNNTNIKLYRNVGFSESDTMKFSSRFNQVAFFDDKLEKVLESKYKIITEYVDIPSEDMGYYELQKIDYVSTERVISGDWKEYYYRVEGIESVNDRVTRLHLELDVLQSYMFDYTIRNAYIEREHQDRKDSNNKRIISKTQEPFEIEEYDYIESDLHLPYHDLEPNIYAAIITTKRDYDLDKEDDRL